MKTDWVTWACLLLAAIGITNLLFSLIKGMGIFGVANGPLTWIQNVLNSVGLISMAAGPLARGRLGVQFPEALANALVVIGVAFIFLSGLLGALLIPWVRTNYQHLPPALRELGQRENMAYEQWTRGIHDRHEARRQARAARRQA